MKQPYPSPEEAEAYLADLRQECRGCGCVFYSRERQGCCTELCEQAVLTGEW